MSDRIAVFNAGKIEQIDSPHVIYDTPRTRFVAEFIGETNLIEAKVSERQDDQATVRPRRRRSVACARAGNGLAAGQTASFSLRPERMRLGSSASGRATRST